MRTAQVLISADPDVHGRRTVRPAGHRSPGSAWRQAVVPPTRLPR
jgi:hypothetical protein